MEGCKPFARCTMQINVATQNNYQTNYDIIYKDFNSIFLLIYAKTCVIHTNPNKSRCVWKMSQLTCDNLVVSPYKLPCMLYTLLTDSLYSTLYGSQVSKGFFVFLLHLFPRYLMCMQLRDDINSGRWVLGDLRDLVFCIVCFASYIMMKVLRDGLDRLWVGPLTDPVFSLS